MSFSRLRGQDRAVEALRAALAAGRLAHAYLFTGPDGVGKRKLAKELAKAVLCTTKEDDACDECLTCRAIDKDSSWDYFALSVEDSKGQARPVADPDREIKVGSVRALERAFSLKNTAGRFRVCLIPRAERMNEEAQNALLKTLEEPAGPRLLILTTSQPQALLPTVVSRLARVRLRPLSAEEVAAHLVEEAGVKKTEAKELAAAAGGSIGAALGASLEEVRAARDFAAEHLGAPGNGGALALAESMMNFAREQSNGGRGLEPVRRGLLALWGTVAELHRQALWRSLEAADPAGAAFEERATERLAALGPDPLRRRLRALLSAERAVGGYASPDLVCRVLAGKLTSG